ncbi:hypothetical protein BBJ29_005485 [Phytophthora kernoviae]|uniref:J domain-containing protein n=1 Tax=Phytophthora kernoviae TaxID=325452 RepID=A0A3F2RJT5_9STRA|nr:hypothetical protein BBP00_00006918 [Phytophthora kernoviae]RLN60349.1 hypothetical protein BBJ29_005485 [Phytophthora kernoviae]
MLTGKLLRRGLHRTLKAPQQRRYFSAVVEKEISEAACAQNAKGRTLWYNETDCWKCHHATECCSFFCKACNAIQPISKACHCDYFEMFKIPKHFNLEQRSIEKTYWNLQKRLHPDLYGSKSDFEKELSTVNAAVINDAYKMLKKPNTRVKYLLALHGIDALGETASTAVDPELLMKTMEIRERIAEVSDVDALHEIRVEISENIDAVIAKLGEVYDQAKDLDATKQYAVELQYMVKCAEEIDLREEKLDGY